MSYDSFEDWNDFRRGENPAPVKRTCCECGGPAQGNVDTRRTPDGPWLPLCDACNAADQGGEVQKEKEEESGNPDPYHYGR